MIIHHIKQTPIAWAPEALSDAINKYTEYKSSVSNSIPKHADLIHFHNLSLETTFRSVIQYHSEPDKVNLNFKGPQATVAQYHATLPEYRHVRVLRNVIDFREDEYQLSTNGLQKGPLIVGFTPSTNLATKHGNKGVLETLQILERLRFKHLGKFEYRALQGFSVKDSLLLRKQCHILIDECVTGSYHRTGLEALALGKVAICSLSNEVAELLKKSSGSDYCPFENVTLENLEKFLEDQISVDREQIIEKGLSNRKWMEKYWKPEEVVKEYLSFYSDAMSSFK